MSSPEFGWQSLLQTDAPAECSLRAALFTTYDRTDELFLAEHLLPLLLKLGHEPDAEGAERPYFLIELHDRLNRLHNSLVVVSSTAREELTDAEEGESGTYGWVWRSIRHLTVGSRGRAVQHAKLWLLHWAAADDGIEYLEIVVSSANLTRAAFKGQLQAAWRACLKLHPERSKPRLARWGVLPKFLQELAAQAGDNGRLEPFVELLARADCPQRVTFVASVPETHAREVLRRTPWGAAGLGAIAPPGRGTVRAAILCPFVGSWRADALRRWCAQVGGSPDHLELVWIDKHHPWAWAEKWLLPEASLRIFEEQGAKLLHFRCEPDNPKASDTFHNEHRPTDARWSHAKIYSFSRGMSRRVLVTSANFSPAAWGRNRDGTLTIENFELGVCVEQAAWPFQALKRFEDAQDAWTVPELPGRGSVPITWAQAVWDGKVIDVECRCAYRELTGEIRNGHNITPFADWTFDSSGLLRSARIPWGDTERPPLLVRLTCDGESVSVPVFDQRPWSDREGTVPPEVADEVGEDLAQRMRDELLFERYGGRVGGDVEGQPQNDGAELPDEEDKGDGCARPDSYSVAAFDLARQHFVVVDKWADRVASVGAGDFDRKWLRRDGELLKEAFQRQAERDGQKEAAAAIGAKLAAEELALRLKYFPEA